MIGPIWMAVEGGVYPNMCHGCGLWADNTGVVI